MFLSGQNFFRALYLTFVFTSLLGCRRSTFPSYPDNYREYAYVSNGQANTVSVLDLVYMRPDRVLQVGINPTGLAANPLRNEVYAVNTGSGTVSVIDAEKNSIAATIGVHRQPYFMDVAPDGKRAYVANSGSNSVSVLDLVNRRELAVAGAGEQPGMARVSPDMRSLVVSNRGSGSVSVFSVSSAPGQPALQFRTAFPGCPGATDVVILPNSLKAFAACSGGHQIMVVSLAAAPGSWEAKQDPNQLSDHLLAMLDVGQSPVHLALKPDGGEIFVSNFDSDSISEVSTWTNEVSSTYTIGSKPTHAVISADNGSLWVSDFGGDSVSLYSIDDGQRIDVIRTGSGPDALAFSRDERESLLLIADSRSGDVSVIHTNGKPGPNSRSGAELFTILPAGRGPNDIVIKAFEVR